MDFCDAKPSSSGSLRGRRHVNAVFVQENHGDPPIRRRRGSSLLRTQLDSNSEVYSMNGQRRGKVLIFNQSMAGEGTNVDVERLYNTLPKLGFRKENILQFEDFGYKEMERVAVESKFDKDLESSDCLMVVILTRGGKNDMLLANDGYYHLSEFMEHFTTSALPSMVGKPKLFIIAACRENSPAGGVQLPVMVSHGDGLVDFMVVMNSHLATFPFRNEQGCWFIQELCNVIERTDLETASMFDIFTETQNAVSKRTVYSENNSLGYGLKQVCSFCSTMTKRLYFKSL